VTDSTITEAPPWQTPPARDTTPPPIDVEAYALGQTLSTLIQLGAANLPRSTQVSLGSSEAGHGCDRRIAYKLAGTKPTNVRDPLRALVGSEKHAVLAEIFTQLSIHTGRYLVEVPVGYRGIPGTCDLFDVATGTVIDWKTTLKNKLSHLRGQGPRPSYTTQVQLYGAGLEAAGYEVRHVALAFIALDGDLDDIWVWRTRYDQAVADAAIDRVEALTDQDPAIVPATPDSLCGWCSHYRPGSMNLAIGCPGGPKKGK
jgi:hypothetical protein